MMLSVPNAGVNQHGDFAMISEQQLSEWECLCNKDRLCYPHYECLGLVIPVQSKKLTYSFADKALEIIPQLTARVRELEKEADWLACELSRRETAEKWRKKAQKAVEKNGS